MSSLVFEGFLSTPQMLAAFGEREVLQAMLDFEAALAEAQAAEGLIPAAAASVIAECCKVGRFDTAAIVGASGDAGSLAIPLVKALTAMVKAADAEAARFVHWGTTSQDVIDSGMVLVTRRALGLIEADLAALVEALFAIDERHGAAPVLARTLMQPAQVVSFNFKLAEWIAPLVRARGRLREAAARALQLQLGGAVGTLAVMGDKGDAVSRRVAARLGLREPDAAWHTQRDEWVSLGAAVGVLSGSLGKFARDLSLMAQGEVGELAEPSGGGRGGSSAMPHKRNPVSSMVALAAAQRTPQRVAGLLAAMPQEHERGLGNWQAELAEWAGLFISTHGALRALATAAAGLEVHQQQMRANIDRLLGLVYAEALSTSLAATMGKAAAHALVEGWSHAALREQRQLRDIAQASPEGAALGAETLAALFDADAAADQARRRAGAQLGALRATWRAQSPSTERSSA